MKKGEIMELLVKTIGRDKQYMAEGIFSDQRFIVKKGGKVAELKAVKQVPEYVRNMRSDKSIVSDDKVILQDCTFTSASHAALFVTGNVSNGLRVWKTEDGKYLRESVKAKKSKV